MFTFAKVLLTNVAMNKRLQQFLFAENISQSAFADTVGVARASVSHILSGRNKPGFDFIESLTRAYPALNIEWLITGEGKMYKTSKAEPDLFSSLPAEEFPAPAPNIPEKIDIDSLGKVEQPIETKKTIEKIIVFFSDGSFREIAA